MTSRHTRTIAGPMEPIRLIDAEPTGTTEVAGLMCGRRHSAFYRATEPTYDHAYGDKLRELRQGFGMTLGEAAAVLGLGLAVFSSLEFGKRVPADDAECGRIRGLLMKHAKTHGYPWTPRDPGTPEPTA